eukprot:COSAG01_NODE_10225_length_2216_cov_19.040151_2_plen_81_part_00
MRDVTILFMNSWLAIDKTQNPELCAARIVSSFAGCCEVLAALRAGCGRPLDAVRPLSVQGTGGGDAHTLSPAPQHVVGVL